MPENSNPKPTRLEIELRKPWFGWHPRPTVVFGGRGQPAQWGIGTWQVPTDEPTSVRVYLYNRMWTYGRADYVLEPSDSVSFRLVYSAPWMPFSAGRITALQS